MFKTRMCRPPDPAPPAPGEQAAGSATPSGLGAGLKRILDLGLALAGLVLLAPLVLVLGVAIKWADGGPVFYGATRVGRHGRLFRLYKFRTMVRHADRAAGLTRAADPRITRPGRWLRRTKLDELPQLINVIRGEMSLVGPRPEDPRYVARYTAEQRRVLTVRPGLTGAASVAYRDEARLLHSTDWETVYCQEIMPAKLAIDLAYLDSWTLRTDLLLLLQTLTTLLRQASACLNPITHFLMTLRNRHFLAIDLVIFLLTPLFALGLRLDGILPLGHFGLSLLVSTGAFLVIKFAVFYRSGLYTRFWRYASINELAQIALIGGLVGVLQTLGFFYVLRPLGAVVSDFPRSVPIIDAILTLLVIGGVRYSVRLSERMQERGLSTSEGQRVLVMGAGRAGLMMVKEMQTNPQLGLHPVGFIDDDTEKQRMRIRGVSVLGTRRDIPTLVRDTHAGQVIIAMPQAPGKTIREIVAACEQAGVHAKIVPGIYELLDGRASIKQLRDIEITDLLRRDPIETDTAAVTELLAGRRVLITGGGGSIGSELCRQALRCRPAELIILGHGESSIFEIYNELQRLDAKLVLAHHEERGTHIAPVVIRPIIADIRFAEQLLGIFRDVQPEIVFHAAAHKHVPLMEFNPAEAITNNVLGTKNVLDAATAVGVARFVMISTDKAVNPTSVMGASKRMAELLVHRAAQATGRAYVAVRFGNVLGSRGSVVLTFKQQIAAGGPVTVTHPDMVRYFMTIPEAVQLVLQAAVLGQGREVFTLDMGEPVKIVDLARDLIELSGLHVGRDIDIVFNGMRPGEKLFEELFIAGEDYQRTRHEKIFIAANASQLGSLDLDHALHAVTRAAADNDPGAIVQELCRLIPEFNPAGERVVGIGRQALPMQEQPDLLYAGSAAG